MADNNFSILITTFNDSKNLPNFISSISNQTVTPNYLIVVDGGSKDNTISLIKDLCKKYDINLIIDFGNRLNIAQGYNKAISLCPTREFFIMGVGNTYPSTFLENLLKSKKEKSVDIVYSPIRGVDATYFSKIFNRSFVQYGRNELGRDFNYASNRGVLISKDVFEKSGLFYETFIYAGEDTEFFIRAEKLGFKSFCCKNTYLLWDTPINFSQYLKKNKVNAIADIQCVPWSKIMINVVSRLLFICLLLCSILLHNWGLLIILMSCLLSLIVLKVRCLNIWVILLRIHFFFLPTFYYIKYKKKFMKSLIVYNTKHPLL